MVGVLLDVSRLVCLLTIAFWGGVWVHICLNGTIEGPKRFGSALLVVVSLAIYAPGYVALAAGFGHWGWSVAAIGGAVVIQVGLGIATVIGNGRDL